ncbi:glycosyltransferase [Candidatus Uhrbacteria bacterium]|nr:glycosyltransferase [Candidatus Uhrbacteria bacterium]
MTYTLNIVTHNSDTFLDEVLKHCWLQRHRPQSVIVIDNASRDETLSILGAHQQKHPELTVLRNHSNVGFSKAHNQGIALSMRKGVDAVFLLNPDVLLQSDCARILISELRQNDRIGSVSPFLYRMGSQRDALIDTTGLLLKSSLRVVDRGAGQHDRSQYATGPVLGGSAAAVLYRLLALESIRWNEEVFDEQFFAYKEDVDVALRLLARGWQHWFVSEATGSHYRSHRSGTMAEILRQRRQRSQRTRQYSYRNHVWLIVKNIPVSVLLRQLPWIVLAEAMQLFYFMVTEPKTVLILVDAVRGLGCMVSKRRHALTSQSAPALKKWIQLGI